MSRDPTKTRRLRRAARVALLVAPLLAPSVAGGEEGHGQATGFREVIAFHAARYPAMEIADLYKLAHQAALGSEHAVTDAAAARAWLEREIASLEAVEGEPLFEPLSPDGRLVRVNLRPYLAAGGDPDRLAAAFVQTADRFAGSLARLRSYWSEIEAMAREGELPVSAGELEGFMREAAGSGYPAVHHSPTYRELYRPAYRTVLRSLIAVGE